MTIVYASRIGKSSTNGFEFVLSSATMALAP